MTDYQLLKPAGKEQKKESSFAALAKLLPLLREEKRTMFLASLAIVLNSFLTLLAPVLIGYAIDTYIQTKQYGGIFLFSGILLAIYCVAFFASFVQMRLMGGVGQRVLFRLRDAIFHKLQELPVAFFNQNKAGDLISRINNDTDKLNQFFSQSLMQLIGNLFVIIGAAIFILVINVRLGTAALLPAAALLVFTQLTSHFIRKKNAQSLTAGGGMSAEIQESLDNFKVIVAFNRRDYFRRKFSEANEYNYQTSLRAGYANNVYIPVYGFSSNVAQLIVLAYGIYLISTGSFTAGLLISFLIYCTRFYDPLRQIASIWASFQVAMAGLDRITAILALESDLAILQDATREQTTSLLEFRHVSFRYPDGKEVLHDINLALEPGKTYALVGPTGGGKTTTASLMARLYDPTAGTVLLHGKDLRSYTATERTASISFILQEPFLFSGTVGENILYGNPQYTGFTTEKLQEVLKEANLLTLLERFEQGLETKVSGGDSISLGQKQLIAFMRAVLRKPELLILDEATANIDTVTEQQLEEILKKLPASTTKVIIAHRLNTIENADEIYFVNGGTIIRAGSMQDAVDMLLHDKRKS
ncbi:MAG: multidrug transporter [Candidatus Peribacteria bacterium]|nr:multidrug transporter [Candidatus Peribacteria bacterium]